MIEFFFDISSPWTYLAFHNVQPLARELNVPITWRPILVGGIFNTVNPSVYEFRDHGAPGKKRYLEKDLGDWARHTGLKIKFPPTVFPVNSVKAQRACILLDGDADTVSCDSKGVREASQRPASAPASLRSGTVTRAEGKLPDFARAAFEAYWGEDRDISDDAVLREVCATAGVDGDRVLSGITQPAVKDQLRINTEELVARGGFGTPTMFVNGDDMYFGNDRLHLVREALLRAKA